MSVSLVIDVDVGAADHVSLTAALGESPPAPMTGAMTGPKSPSDLRHCTSMPDDSVLSYLNAVVPRSESEARVVGDVIDLARSEGAWSRSAPLHLTASALIVHPPTRQVLLRWHERQQGWLQVGGHADPGESDPLHIALREGAEETGLDDLRPWPDAQLQHVVVVPVPASDKEPAHHHADLRFVLATDHPERARPENEKAALRWLSVDEAITLVGHDNVRELIEVVAALFD